ncbi:2-dehydropantoate 2-reductase [Siccirubricoccus sp. KC 17139]|uniref:2-dehydropantoate 2-reductase n=1 Tax=Siccirubricoccus soli TaxID=2899147 RepID=A0ABT1D9D4_9PROT|nr:2-dehydropantoate 2-reductase [Siccirubricoccus soli]MCO6418538.1 2-dehydropantoate 2-reductase [Siccirubricoccus soli]MCP2684673.1 2-dehydropantoate 2-reductase [Siccirubricoccus soli]
MKVCIYGAGAVGCYLAGRLHQGGARVSMVARGATLAAIAAEGVTVHTPARQIHARIAVAEDPAALGPQDMVLVTVKAPSLPAIAPGLATLLGPETPVCFVMNGLPWWYFHAHGGPHEGRRLPRIDPGDVTWRTVGPERALHGVIFASCDIERPGVVHIETAQTALHLGEPAGTTARSEALAALLRDADFTVTAEPNIRARIWSKLQTNICSGLFGCLADSPPKAIYSDPAVAEAVRRVVAEVGEVAAALGHPSPLEAEALLRRARSQGHKSSIVQDLARGAPIEFEAMFGGPQALARLAGIPTPTLDLLIALVKARAIAVGAYSEGPVHGFPAHV